MDSHEEDFSIFLVLDEDEEDEDAADYESYVGNMREDGEWGGNLELVAAARLFWYVYFSCFLKIQRHSSFSLLFSNCMYESRNITVFSADLSAFTIPHGEGKTTGPDLLVSYHDNDHYNSVRSNNGVSLSPMSISDDDIDQKHDGELKNGYYSTKANESSGENSKKASVKKSDPCHCGSGQKYKKCCLKREKHVARVKKIQKDDDSDEGDETEKNVDGGFRVMKI